MKQLPHPDDAQYLAVRTAAAFVAATLLACGADTSRAQDYYKIGPRSVYGVQSVSSSEVPLVMRDAVQYLVTGKRLLSTAERVVGGQPAAPGAYPWTASLQIFGSRNGEGHFCGGAFITAEWVITAAHCVFKNVAGKIQVVGQTETLDSGGNIYAVDRVITHEKYDADSQDFDVALLHLKTPSSGRTIPLITSADGGRLDAPGVLAIVAGWGLTSEGGEVSNILRQVSLELVSNQVCNGLASYSGGITAQMICAGFAAGGKDSCQGDSGGPLIVPDLKGGYVLAGVVSFGDGCALPNKFGVYTRVSLIQEWVAGKIGSRAAPQAEVVSQPGASSRSRMPVRPAAAGTRRRAAPIYISPLDRKFSAPSRSRIRAAEPKRR